LSAEASPSAEVMLQVLQSLSDGATSVIEVPVPAPSGVDVLVETRFTVVSPGTERMLVDFGRASLIDKARKQPDRVAQVLGKVRTDGLAPTLEAVRAKLGTPIPLGYCQAGVVVGVGSRVEGISLGDRVVTNGPHAEYARVPWTLAAKIPDSVSFEAAAFAPLGAIGLQGFRLAAPTVGESVVVYGLGLVGLLTAQIARAAGCCVIGIEKSPERARLAQAFGVDVITSGDCDDVVTNVLGRTGGDGADAVILTLATDRDEPVHAAAAMSRKRGRIVLVGVTGLGLRRDDFYKKELSFQVSCSYGPGRYDPAHEEKGIDYPRAFVRWTEGRNFAAVLGLMADHRVDPLPFVTHRFDIGGAARAYEIVAGSEPSLGIVLSYPAKTAPPDAGARTIAISREPTAAASGAVVGWIGAGNYASRFLIPAFARAGASLDTLASAGGISAAVVGTEAGFRSATTDAATILADPRIDVVVVATRHDSHADWVGRALVAGKHVFVEKPLALAVEDVARIAKATNSSGRILCVGYNRRFAPMVVRAKQAVAARSGPLAISILVNAGEIPRDSWVQDRAVGGGRIVGEACHFIDLARHLVGSQIARAAVLTASTHQRVTDDIASILVGFRDGSTATIQYLSNGHRTFPKERIECFFDGKTLRIDNYRRLSAWGIEGLGTLLPQSQDKGQAELVDRFVRAVRRGQPSPISLEEIVEVSEWSLRVAEMAARGGNA
jgi:predicted dehydrogenase/threonine dehydrogenase-like Zn-dependent dehydrogenase